MSDAMKTEKMEELFETDLQPWMMLNLDGIDVPVKEVKEVQVEHMNLTTDARIYYPEGDKPFPVMFYIHGGAFVGGFNGMDEPICRKMCCDGQCAVISPNYQLAPAHKFPAALNELYDLLLYFKAHAAEYQLDMNRLAIGGSSAGGNFAAALCVKAYQTKELKFKYQALLYPSIDLKSAGETKVTPLTDTVAMEPKGIREMLEQYTAPGEDLSNPLLSPFFGPAEAFPKTSIFNGNQCIFWKEDKEFADRLASAGVEVLFKSYANVGHGFMELKGHEEVSRDVKQIISNEIKRNL